VAQPATRDGRLMAGCVFEQEVKVFRLDTIARALARESCHTDVRRRAFFQ
jgi:hypothetical protein